ncbi:MAG: AzlC family ABC transporter permease [Ruminococcaceae bacterium]|nr:AzlC family ABC transporter permease [Oscillospiraceae bacterium]
MQKKFTKGLIDGVPIGLGYLSVSFGFGILAVKLGIPVFHAWLISAACLTSAGQVAGIEIIAACGTLAEIAISQFVINLRYSLMGFSLTQKLDHSFTTAKRMLVSFGITDEVFAVAVSKKGKLSPAYMAGLITLPFCGWTCGTLAGALASHLLPKAITNALGILLYGMFIAIFTPPAKKSKPILLAVVLAAFCSVIIKYLFTFISGGFSIIFSALIASVVCAALFPIPDEEEL